MYVNVRMSWLRQAKAPGKIFDWAQKFFADNYDVVGTVDIPKSGASEYTWDQVTVAPKEENNIWVFRRQKGAT